MSVEEPLPVAHPLLDTREYVPSRAHVSVINIFNIAEFI